MPKICGTVAFLLPTLPLGGSEPYFYVLLGGEYLFPDPFALLDCKKHACLEISLSYSSIDLGIIWFTLNFPASNLLGGLDFIYEQIEVELFDVLIVCFIAPIGLLYELVFEIQLPHTFIVLLYKIPL